MGDGAGTRGEGRRSRDAVGQRRDGKHRGDIGVKARRERFQDTLRAAIGRRGVALMGVCNATPDSFSDGGRYFSPEAARARVDELLREGADIVDVGGESTRPGAPPVAATEQLGRILPVIEYAASRVCVSVDTTDPEVARIALDAGAAVINDVSCLAQPELARVAFDADATLVVMHSRPAHFAGASALAEAFRDEAYGDVGAEVLAEWWAAVRRAEALGISLSKPGALVFDGGLGFAKTARQSVELLRRTAEFVAALPVPVLVGASRKSFLKLVDAEAGPDERSGGSLAAALWAAGQGAQLLRVHDVRATAQAIDVHRLLGPATPGTPGGGPYV